MTQPLQGPSRRRVLTGAVGTALSTAIATTASGQTTDESKKESGMNASKKPSIVFAHGIWADGSCFNKLVPTLQAEGHDVICAQYGLDTLKGDVDATIRTIARTSGPVVLVGHSYGGTVITKAGMVLALISATPMASSSGQ